MLVSLIITSYNYARYLERAIRSALNQSLEHNNFEVIVVDDCSKDESHMILDNYCDEIRTIRFSENKGLSAARYEQPPFHCNPILLHARSASHTKGTPFPSHDIYAEFLLLSSLKRLRIFILPTCVGLRYGLYLTEA